jgi:MFS family permease
VAATAGVAFGGVVSDRIARRSLKARMLVMALYYFGAAPCLLTFLWSTSYSLVSLSLFFYSLLRAMGTVNEHPIICDVLNTRSRSTAIGLANSANCLAGGIGIFVAGYLKKDFGLSGVFGGVSVIVAIAGLLTLAGYLWFIERDLKARGQAA